MTITTSRNQTRTLKCASCRTTATRVLANTDATVTTLRDCLVYGGKTEWADTSASQISTCERHLALNTRRVQQLEPVTIDRRHHTDLPTR